MYDFENEVTTIIPNIYSAENMYIYSTGTEYVLLKHHLI